MARVGYAAPGSAPQNSEKVMGDNRDATRAPGAAPAAEKKAPAADAGGGGAMPEGAAADPGSALTMLAANYGAQLVGMMQSAGGNAEVDAELSSLLEGQAVAAQAKSEKDALNAMSDGEKVEKHGAKGGGGGGEGAKGEGGGGAGAGPDQAPPGVADPGAAAGFHAARGGEVAALAAQHASVAASLGAASAVPGLAPELVAFLGEGAAQSAAQQAALNALASTYSQVGGALAGSEYLGAAMPSSGTAAQYEVRVQAIAGVVSTLDAMCGEYDAAVASEQAKITECDALIVQLQTQIAEAAAAKGDAGGAGGGGAPGAADATKSSSHPPGQEPAAAKKTSTPAPAGGGTGKTSGAAGGGAKTEGPAASQGSTGNMGLPPEPAAAAAPEPAAEAKAGPGGGDAAAALTAQIEQQRTKKQGIESQISSNTALINAIKTYRDQMNGLLAAYSGGSTPPAGGGA